MSDERRRAENIAAVEASSSLMLCDYCGGTGNEFYSMYRACPECGGVGVVDRVSDKEQQ
jgi:DnaJ-class molecular chaperone